MPSSTYRVKPILARLVLLSISTLIACIIAYWIMSLAGINLQRRLWLARTKITGPEAIGIWQDDPVFGWTNKPGQSGRHREPPDFDVRYNIDRFKHRITSASYNLPKILFLGGSFTFGNGVEDEEVYPALLQEKWPQYKVINAAVNAWGTSQALLKLEEQLTMENNHLRLVVYAFMSHHIQRNYLRKIWLDQLKDKGERRNPYFELIEGELVFQGLADPQRDGLPNGAELDAKELTITLKLMERMHRLCREEAVPLLFVYLPDPFYRQLPPRFVEIFGREFCLDLRQTVDYSKIHFEFDSHPTPQGHRLLAEAIHPALARMLVPGHREH
jgi:hypothetical protein